MGNCFCPKSDKPSELVEESTTTKVGRVKKAPHRFSNGASYSGEWVGGVKKAPHRFSNGASYSGEWVGVEPGGQWRFPTGPATVGSG